MHFLYNIPGYFLLLFGGFCLSWGGYIIRSFEEATVWQILLLRSVFFMFALMVFLIATYKKNTIKIIKDAGFPAVLGGLVMSLSFIAFVVSMSITSVANVVFIIRSDNPHLVTMLRAIEVARWISLEAPVVTPSAPRVNSSAIRPP